MQLALLGTLAGCPAKLVCDLNAPSVSRMAPKSRAARFDECMDDLPAPELPNLPGNEEPWPGLATPTCIHANRDPNVAYLAAGRLSLDVCDEPTSKLGSIDHIERSFLGLWRCQLGASRPLPSSQTACDSDFMYIEDSTDSAQRIVVIQDKVSGQARAQLGFRSSLSEAVLTIEMPVAAISSSLYSGFFCGHKHDSSCRHASIAVAVRASGSEGTVRSLTIAFSGVEHCKLPARETGKHRSQLHAVDVGLITSLREPGPWNESAMSRLEDLYARVWQLLQGEAVLVGGGTQCVDYPYDAKSSSGGHDEVADY
jgi:hypothetical protein